MQIDYKGCHTQVIVQFTSVSEGETRNLLLSLDAAFFRVTLWPNGSSLSQPVPEVPAVGPPQVALAANREANVQPEVVQPAPVEPHEKF